MKKTDRILFLLHIYILPAIIITASYGLGWDFQKLTEMDLNSISYNRVWALMNISTLVLVVWYMLGFLINVFIISAIEYFKEKRNNKKTVEIHQAQLPGWQGGTTNENVHSKECEFSQVLLNRLILTQIDGKYVFLLDNLTEEEMEYIHRKWCNAKL